MPKIITDRPGIISAEAIRTLFERAAVESRWNLPMEWSGQYYLDRETHARWIGFALGMRCADRMVTASGEANLTDIYSRWEMPPLPAEAK